MEETCLIVDFLKKIKEITTQLISIRKLPQENELVRIMLNILPKSFESFISGMKLFTFMSLLLQKQYISG
jgi:hypothetical protein